jgi:DNA invertase Pin-like site-specific DNA recombinase
MSSPEKIGATYCRVSDPDDVRTASLETQEEAAVARLESSGYRVPPEFRFRELYTGMESIYDRPVLLHLRELVDRGEVQAICCYDTDRLARDPDELLAVVTACKRRGAEVLFTKIDQAIEGRIGHAILYMKGLASALEYDAIRDRTMRGRMKILQRGQWIGGGPVRFGYRFDPVTRRRTEDPETAPIVRRVFEMVAGGMSAVDVTHWLNEQGIATPSRRRGQNYKDGRGARWSHSTVTLLIRDETYIGRTVARRMMPDPTGARRPNGRRRMVPRPPDQRVPLSDDSTVPLVTEELFRAANAVLRGYRPNQLPRANYKSPHLLSGFIFCGVCGCRMAPASPTKKRISKATGKDHGSSRCYRCTGDAINRKASRTGCMAVVGARWVEAAVWEAIEGIVTNPEFLRREIARGQKDRTEERIRSDLAAAEKRRKQLDRKLKALVESFGDQDGPAVRDAVKSTIATCDREIQSADRQIADLKARLVPFADLRRSEAEILDHIRSLQSEIRNPAPMTVDRKRDLFTWLGLRAFVKKGGECEIRLDLRVTRVCDAYSDNTSGGTSTPAAR